LLSFRTCWPVVVGVGDVLAKVVGLCQGIIPIMAYSPR
jgi:hypothetical protein